MGMAFTSERRLSAQDMANAAITEAMNEEQGLNREATSRGNDSNETNTLPVDKRTGGSVANNTIQDASNSLVPEMNAVPSDTTHASKRPNNDRDDPSRLSSARDNSRKRSCNSLHAADHHDLKEKIAAIWTNAKDEKGLENAVNFTLSIFGAELDTLIQCGVEAFHRSEQIGNECEILKEELAGTKLELERVRNAEAKGRETISNLLRATETSYSKSRDSSESAVKEAKLRAEVSHITTKRDEALSQAEECKRKNTLLEEEISQIKIKLQRITQEKIKLERDQRATMSLAKSLENHGSSDLEFYKRKTQEFTMTLQSKNALMAEKNRQIEDLRRQLERQISQNRLASIYNGTDSRRN